MLLLGFQVSANKLGTSNFETETDDFQSFIIAGDTLTNPSDCGLGIPINDNSCTAAHQFPILVTTAPGDSLGFNVYLQEVRLSIQHEWDADLDLWLISPSGIVVELSTDNGSGNDNYGNPSDTLCENYTSFISQVSLNSCDAGNITDGVAPFIGNYLPEGNLNDFNDGIDPNDVWIIQVCDDAKEHFGTLEFVELVFAPIACLTPTNITLIQVDSTTVQLDWVPGSNCSNTIIEYGIPGFTPGTGFIKDEGIEAISTTCPPVIINSLESGSVFEFYVREFCGGSSFSDNSCSINATTLCSPPPVTLLETFDALSLCPTTCGQSCDISGTWSNANLDSFDWTIDDGGTLTSLTGPSDDVTGGGNYAYIETSSSSCQNTNQAILISNCIEVRANPDTCDMSFFYHLYGTHVNKVSLEVTTDGGLIWQTLWEEQGNQGDEWQLQFIDLDPFHGDTVQFRFVGHGGIGIRGDLAIDHISFYGSEDLGAPPYAFYLDLDGDNYGNDMFFVMSCDSIAPNGFVAQGGDCDDNIFAINPGAMESPCDGFDVNCNGFDDEDFLYPPITENDTICSGGFGTVFATLAPFFGGEIHWYDSIVGGNLVHTGQFFSPDDLPENNSSFPITKTYYAEQVSTVGCISNQRASASIFIFNNPEIHSNTEFFACVNDEIDLSDITISDENSTAGSISYYESLPFILSNELIDPLILASTNNTYYILKTTSLGCFDSTEINVNILPSPEINVITDTTLCRGTSQSISVTDIGNGIIPLSYSWNTGETSSTIQILSSPIVGNIDSYSVTVTGDNGCSDIEEINIETVAGILSVQTNTQNVSSCNGSDGVFNFLLNGGTPPFDYEWEGPTSGQGTSASNLFSISDLLQGSYSVSFTDSSPEGCEFVIPIAVVNGPSAIISLDEITKPSCNGASDGCIAIEVSGNDPQIFWSSGDSTEIVCGLSSDNYYVTVTDGMCSNVLGPIFLPQPKPITANPTITNTACVGESNGIIHLSISGGTPPYSFLWNNAAMTADLINISAGTYAVTITDINDCSFEINGITVEDPEPLDFAVDLFLPPTCFGEEDGEVTVSVTGGTAPYDIVWDNNQFGTFIRALGSGTYFATITDANGCSIIESVDVTQPPPMSYNLTGFNNASCQGVGDGMVQISPTGGSPNYSVEWSNGIIGFGILNLDQGQYWGTISDANGCTQITDTFNIKGPSDLDITTSQSNPTCQGVDNGSISITVNNGFAPFDYNWENGATSPMNSGLSAGVYPITITEANGCQFDTIFYLDTIQLLSADRTVIQPACFGIPSGQINLFSVIGGSPPYDIDWSNGQSGQQVNNLSAGQYDATITDNLGCYIKMDTVELIYPDTLEIEMVTLEEIACHGGSEGSIDINLTGGTPPFSYAWNNGKMTQDISGLGQGLYFVNITDGNGCVIQSHPITINEPAEILATHNLVNIPDCGIDPIDSVCVAVQGGLAPYSYEWSNGAATSCLVNAPTDDYSITITDAAGCTEIMMSIKVPDPIPSLVVESLSGETVDINCNGEPGEILVQIIGGVPPYQYNWSHGNPGITDIDTLSLFNLETGACNVTVVDNIGCFTISDSFHIVQPEPLVVFAEGVNNVKCKSGNDGSIDINISGGVQPYNFSWLNQIQELVSTDEDPTFLTAGEYFLEVIDSNGCQFSLMDIPITEPDLELTIFDIPPNLQNITCKGDSNAFIDLTPIGGIPPYSIIWNNNETSEDLFQISAGTYSVTIEDANICKLIPAPFVIEEPEEALNISDSDIFNINCFGDSDGAVFLSVTGGWSPLSYAWNVNKTSQDIENVSAGNYSVTITDDEGCQIDSSFQVTEPPELLINTGMTPVTETPANGTAWVEVSGGSPPYSILWSNFELTDTITNLESGTYEVTVSDDHDCQMIGFAAIPVNVIDLNSIANIELFPNPTKSLLFLNLELKNSADLQFRIVNLIGQSIYDFEKENVFMESLQIDLEDAPSGIYLLQILKQGELIYTDKIVLER